MGKLFIKFLSSLVILSLFGIVLLDYIILPNYVGYDNEHYLPDVRGEYLEKAAYQLNLLGFHADIVTVPFSENQEPGKVVKMFPRAFTKVKEGRTINLTIAGKLQDIEIPGIINFSLRNAKLEIAKLGLSIDTIIYEYDNDIPEGFITFQLPKDGQVVRSATKITFGVSRGTPPDYYIIPDVVNMSLQRAKEKIVYVGLRVGEINYEYQPDLLNNTVIEQNMTAGMRVSFPATIDLLISTDKQ